MSDAIEILDNAIKRQQAYVEQWRQPIEPLLFETLRAIDALYCGALLDGHASDGDTARLHNAHSTWA
jgi:hypothetical protein